MGRPPGAHPVFVWNNEDAAVAAAHSVDPVRWREAFGAVLDRIEGRFPWYEPLRHAAGLTAGHRAGAGPQELLDHR